MSHWIEFVAAIVLGAFAGKYLPEWWEHTNNRVQQSAAKRILEPTDKSAILRWLIEYYTSRGRTSDLYRASLGDRQVMIPFLTKDELTVSYPISTRRAADKVLELITEPSMHTFAVDRREIRRRIKVGKKVYDAPASRFLIADSSHGNVSVETAESRYLQCATTWFRLETETLRCSRKRRRYSPYRDSTYASFQMALAASAVPKLVGVGVLILSRNPNDGEPEVLIQTSSGEIASALGGSRSIVPFFAVSPVVKAAKWSYLEINVLREIGEELFGFQELEDAKAESHFDPEWFLRLSPLAELCDGLAAGDTPLWYLSSGFDAFNGTFEIHVTIDMSKPMYRNLLEQAVGNWEIAKSNDNTHLSFVPLASRDFLDWYLSGALSNGSAVAISQVRRIIDQYGNGPADASLLFVP